MKTILVLVGTTRHDDLVQAVSSDLFLEKLMDLNLCDLLIIQKGQGDAPKILGSFSFGIEYHTFISDLSGYIKSLNHENERLTVISHAGTGIVLDVLRNSYFTSNDDGVVVNERQHDSGAVKTPYLILVPNETLMDNHQLEVAQSLSDMNCVTMVRISPKQLFVERLLKALEEFGHVKGKLPEAPIGLLDSLIDKCLSKNYANHLIKKGYLLDEHN